MTQIRGKTSDVEFALRLYSYADENDPLWIQTHLQFGQGGVTKLSTTLSITEGDVQTLEMGMLELVAGDRRELTVVTGDDDLVIEARIEVAPDTVSIGFWVGEPYQVMTGFRFMADVLEIQRFARELDAEIAAIRSSHKAK